MYIFVKVFVLYVCSQCWNHPVGASSVQEGLGRVIGGTNAKANEFPFLIAIAMDDKVSCGGSLITPNYVLTAAHCFLKHRAPHVFAIAGEHIISKASTKRQKMSTKKIIPHEKFNNRTMLHDIALLELTEPFKLTKAVKTIALAGPDYVPSGYVTVAGWGVTELNATTGSDILQKLRLPIANHTKCEENYSKIEMFVKNKTKTKPNPGKVTDMQICAGFKKGGKDTCSGDSGGPLIAIIKDVPTVVGITSWGAECALAGYPGIYTDITKYLSWISSHIK